MKKLTTTLPGFLDNYLSYCLTLLVAPHAARGYSSCSVCRSAVVTTQPDPRISSSASTGTPIPKRFTGTVITRWELPHDTDTAEDTIIGQPVVLAKFSVYSNMHICSQELCFLGEYK